MRIFALLASLLLASGAALAAEPVEVPITADASAIKGHPLTAVVVTQCNLLVAVYMTMPDGRLVRIDKSAQIPADKLLVLAYSATRSERVEVSCNAEGVVGYEKHGAI